MLRSLLQVKNEWRVLFFWHCLSMVVGRRAGNHANYEFHLCGGCCMYYLYWINCQSEQRRTPFHVIMTCPSFVALLWSVTGLWTVRLGFGSNIGSSMALWSKQVGFLSSVFSTVRNTTHRTVSRYDNKVLFTIMWFESHKIQSEICLAPNSYTKGGDVVRACIMRFLPLGSCLHRCLSLCFFFFLYCTRS